MATELNEIISEKQQQLIDTGKELFSQHGIKRVTVKEICNKADVSKMTFYKYFDNKIDLVKYIVDDWTEIIWKKVDEIEAMEIPFSQKLNMIFEYKWKILEQTNDDFLKELLELDIDTSKSMERFVKFMADAQHRGDIRQDIKLELIITMLDRLSEWAQDENLIKLYPTFKELNKDLFNMLYYGILPRNEGNE